MDNTADILKGSVPNRSDAQAAANRVAADHAKAMADKGRSPTPIVRTPEVAKANVTAGHATATSK